MVNAGLKWRGQAPVAGHDCRLAAKQAHFCHENCVNQWCMGLQKSFWPKRFLVYETDGRQLLPWGIKE
jgi:hypothetical protein